jgi:hypothetical protein
MEYRVPRAPQAQGVWVQPEVQDRLILDFHGLTRVLDLQGTDNGVNVLVVLQMLPSLFKMAELEV